MNNARYGSSMTMKRKELSSFHMKRQTEKILPVTKNIKNGNKRINTSEIVSKSVLEKSNLFLESPQIKNNQPEKYSVNYYDHKSNKLQKKFRKMKESIDSTFSGFRRELDYISDSDNNKCQNNALNNERICKQKAFVHGETLTSTSRQKYDEHVCKTKLVDDEVAKSESRNNNIAYAVGNISSNLKYANKLVRNHNIDKSQKKYENEEGEMEVKKVECVDVNVLYLEDALNEVAGSKKRKEKKHKQKTVSAGMLDEDVRENNPHAPKGKCRAVCTIVTEHETKRRHKHEQKIVSKNSGEFYREDSGTASRRTEIFISDVAVQNDAEYSGRMKHKLEEKKRKSRKSESELIIVSDGCKNYVSDIQNNNVCKDKKKHKNKKVQRVNENDVSELKESEIEENVSKLCQNMPYEDSQIGYECTRKKKHKKKEKKFNENSVSFLSENYAAENSFGVNDNVFCSVFENHNECCTDEYKMKKKFEYEKKKRLNCDENVFNKDSVAEDIFYSNVKRNNLSDKFMVENNHFKRKKHENEKLQNITEDNNVNTSSSEKNNVSVVQRRKERNIKKKKDIGYNSGPVFHVSDVGNTINHSKIDSVAENQNCGRKKINNLHLPYDNKCDIVVHGATFNIYETHDIYTNEIPIGNNDVPSTGRKEGIEINENDTERSKYPSYESVLHQNSIQNVIDSTSVGNAADCSEKQSEMNDKTSVAEYEDNDSMSLNMMRCISLNFPTFIDIAPEPLEFEIPPLHAFETVYRLTAAQKEDLTRKGVVIKNGKWTKQEDLVLQKNFNDFIKKSEIKDPYLLLGIEARTRQNPNIKKYLKAKHFYAQLGKDLNERPLYSIYRRARVLLHPLKNKSKCDEVEILDIYKQQNLLGNKWSKIGERMGRSGENCYNAFRWHEKNINEGPWTSEEIESLKSAIKKVAGTSDLLDGKIIPKISWHKVSNHVPTRNFSQCRQYWATHWFKPNDSCQKWTKTCTRKLLHILKTEWPVEDEALINWRKIYESFKDVAPSYFFILKRWHNLKVNNVRKYRDMTYKEIIKFLSEKYLS